MTSSRICLARLCIMLAAEVVAAPAHAQALDKVTFGTNWLAEGEQGGFRTFDIDQAPRELMDIAARAARPIGDGFYGVDIKQTDSGFVVMEVNDNPNLEHGIEDQVGKDEIWIKLLRWFIDRFEQ